MLPYGRQSVDENDINAVVEALRSDWLTTGPRVEEFEEAFAAACGARYAVAVSNGTAALHAAAYAARIGSGDEVVTTPMTFAATANCIRYVDATPVFADVQPCTLNIEHRNARAALTPRTKAVICTDYAGQPCDYEELAGLCDERGLVLIDDAAHALGATYKQRRIGSIAHMTTFSLHPVKHVTSGEGGVVTTNDLAYAAAVRTFRNHGITQDYRERERLGSWWYEIHDLGFNYRITDFQCALGGSQLK
ncbi:MAG: aminotransferase class I/II-fold pyridoxal phosphate-dependent enzyme, partial [Acetobacteraceae bacterium]|nr:aminotransferase class I/II-fold pyridoxal phosphate-dependent enzyme [Acetobacteraceae bacterium]